SQVLINYLTNAIKYSPNTDRIIVKTEVKGDALVVSVQDFGRGIPPEKQQQIFERFYRVDSKSTDNPTGLGLGLYISSEIIKRHHGQTWFVSRPSQGSTFYFSLPLSSS
ncbi:MAG TPA: ATP-binding protein, partial [Patescibacteria group bacterium]